MQQKINSFFNKHSKLSAFLLGSFSVQALPPFYHWYILIFCLSSFILLLNNSHSKKHAFIIGWLFGFGFFAFGLSWINNALLISPEQTGWLIPFVFTLSGAFFGLFIGIPAVISWLFKPLYARYLSFASFIVIFEWIRSWIFTGFPWNLWGTCLAFNLELIQIASVLGSYGLSFITILTFSSPALIINYRNRCATLIVFAMIFALTSIYIWGSFRIKSLTDDSLSNINIRLVQPSIPQSIKWDPLRQQQHFQKYINMSQASPFDNITMTIWGETASPYALDIDINAKNQAIKAISSTGYLTTGLVRYENDYYGGYQPLNSSLIINKQGIIEDFYDKSHLVPFGEYIPFRQYLPEFIRPITNTISNFKSGSGPKIINLPNIPPFGIQICYEIIFPHQIINPQQKPAWLINLTNDGWYGISAGPYQHMTNTKLRAVEEGLTIIRSANSGISGIINRYGKILSFLPLNKEDILDIQLPQQLQIKTIYNSFGNIIILILCFLNVLLAAYINAKHH